MTEKNSMFNKGDTVYTVQGYYPEDVVINVLHVVHAEDDQVWVTDEDFGSYLVDTCTIIPGYEDALIKFMEQTDILIDDLTNELKCQKDCKKELKSELSKLKRRTKK